MKMTAPLKENHLFRRAYSKGKTAADSRLALYVRRNGQKANRLGFTVSTKVGCAVVRNRVRATTTSWRNPSSGWRTSWAC